MSAGTVVHADEVTPQPWVNGGGTTRELVRADDGAWRVSLADIERDGPFSPFPGRRRLLTVVDGAVLALVVDGAESLVEPRRPFSFDGDAVVSASTPEGAVRALNVMVDPGAVQSSVTVLELGRGSSLTLADDQAALVVQGRPVVGETDLRPWSFVSGPAEVAGRSTLAVITLERRAP